MHDGEIDAFKYKVRDQKAMMNARVRYAMRFMQSFRFRCRCEGFYGASPRGFREQ